MSRLTVEQQNVVEQWLADFHAAGSAEEDNYLAKRTSPRFVDWSEPLEIKFRGKTTIGRGMNLNQHGVGFLCKHRFKRGDEAEIRRDGDGQDCWVPIIVRHATQTIGQFKVGAIFRNA